MDNLNNNEEKFSNKKNNNTKSFEDEKDLDNVEESAENNNKLKIIKGNSKELNISKVQNSLPFEAEENCEEVKKNIVVPKNQND